MATSGKKKQKQEEPPQIEDISLSPLEDAIENPIQPIKNEKIYEKDEN